MRRPAAPNRPRTSRLKSFPAPTAGWIANRNLATPNIQGMAPGAERLENFFPTASGAVLRRGKQRYATLGESGATVTALFSYKNGAQEKLFAANATDIYDITSVTLAESYLLVTHDGDPLATDGGDNFGEYSTTGLEELSGLTGGDWIVVQFANSGGVYLIGVNGEDDSFLYDGTRFYPVGGDDLETLAYDGGSAAFTVGDTVTGGTSGATAAIVLVDGDATSGTLIIHSVAGGPFQDNEALTDGAGGSADAAGANAAAYNGITGVATSDLDFVWVYKNRVFFVEKGSLDAWYLAVDSIGGAATKFPLGGVFTLGGELMFGASWSLGDGASGGLSAQCVFVSTEGEVAVYQGADPGSSSDWSLVGVYRIGRPLGKRAFIRAGGDLVISTDIGFVPLSQAIQRDYAALSPSAVSFPIEDAWREATELRTGASWNCEVWPSKQMVVVALPTVNEQPAQWFVANTRTGAWGLFTGWNATCMEVFQGRLFFGSVDGKVVEANVTGEDEGETFTGVYVPLFDDFRAPGSMKVGELARAIVRSGFPLNGLLALQADFQIDLPSDPPSATFESSSSWGDAIWGESVWGQASQVFTYQDWQSVGGYGYALAPSLQITSGSVVPIDAEIIRVDLTYVMGDIVT